MLLVRATITAASSPIATGITTSGNTPAILISPTTSNIAILIVRQSGGAVPLVTSTIKHGDMTQ